MGSKRPAVPDRVRWAIELLDPAPGDHVLEIGPGAGVAAGLVCARLGAGDGRLLAVDRSPVATRRTAERNAEHVAAGRLEVRTADLAALELPAGALDSAFSIDVNLFWTRSPARELALLAAALRPGGALHVCFGADGPQSAQRITVPIAAAMTEHGFVDVVVRVEGAGTAVSSRQQHR